MYAGIWVTHAWFLQVTFLLMSVSYALGVINKCSRELNQTTSTMLHFLNMHDNYVVVITLFMSVTLVMKYIGKTH